MKQGKVREIGEIFTHDDELRPDSNLWVNMQRIDRENGYLNCRSLKDASELPTHWRSEKRDSDVLLIGRLPPYLVTSETEMKDCYKVPDCPGDPGDPWVLEWTTDGWRWMRSKPVGLNSDTLGLPVGTRFRFRSWPERARNHKPTRDLIFTIREGMEGGGQRFSVTNPDGPWLRGFGLLPTDDIETEFGVSTIKMFEHNCRWGEWNIGHEINGRWSASQNDGGKTVQGDTVAELIDNLLPEVGFSCQMLRWNGWEISRLGENRWGVKRPPNDNIVYSSFNDVLNHIFNRLKGNLASSRTDRENLEHQLRSYKDKVDAHLEDFNDLQARIKRLTDENGMLKSQLGDAITEGALKTQEIKNLNDVLERIAEPKLKKFVAFVKKIW